MNRFTLFAPLLFSALSGLAIADDDVGGCKTNFSVSGSFLSGKQYKTQLGLPKLSQEAAFKKTYAVVVKHGYQVTQSDKDAGVISAAQQVSYSSGGKSAPFNIIVEAAGDGSNVSFSFATAGGLMASADTVRDEFCKMADEISTQ